MELKLVLIVIIVLFFGKIKNIAKKIIQKALQLSDIVLVTFEDEKKLFGVKNPVVCAKRLHQQGIKEVVIKLGAKGSLISTSKGQTLIPAKKGFKNCRYHRSWRFFECRLFSRAH